MMKKIRTHFLVFIYDNTQDLYRKYFKRSKKEWSFNEEQLLQLEKDSLGQKLGVFYKKNGFRMIPKMENHDVYHLITEYSTQIEDEIAMQYLLFGNGKRSAYLLGVLFLGSIIFPEYIKTYNKAYIKGKQMRRFYHYDFEALLNNNFYNLKQFLNQ